MIKPTTSRLIPGQRTMVMDGIEQQTQELLPGLTPSLWFVIFGHHERYHVQLLLMGVVGLQAALTIPTETHLSIQQHQA